MVISMDGRYAVVRDGVVENVVVWNGDEAEWQPPEGTQAVLIPEGVNVAAGYTYDGRNFNGKTPE